MADARLQRDPSGGWHLQHSSAGHLPLLLRMQDGRVDLLDDPPDLPLGVEIRPRASHRLALEAGTTVVACTDGLLERRGKSLDEGLRRLVVLARTAPEEPAALVEHLLHGLGGGDDAAVLALRLGASQVG